MIPLDLKNVYASFPKIEAFNLLKEILTSNSKLNINEIQELFLSVHIIICQNYYQYNKQFYSQIMTVVDGALSAILGI